MTLSLRGRVTGLSGVPQHWRGPMPDVSIRRDLPPLDGYAQVPMELLFGGHADLAVLTWAWLRLRSDDRADVASYQQFADALGYAHLTPKAVQKRFSAALGSLLDKDAPLGRWLERERTSDNQQLYRAVVPAGTGKRWAMLRRCDLALLTLPAPRKAARPVSVADLADFGRWQLECGQRGWTADPLSAIAARWKVSEATLWRSRAQLEAVKLLEVTNRPGGRYPDLVWLKELHDPHWQVASVPVQNSQRAQDQGGLRGPEVSFTPGGASPSNLGGPSFQDRGVGSFNDGGSYKRNLTGGSLTEDLTELGGASATPLTLLPREPRDTASPREKDHPSSSPTPAGRDSQPHRVAGQLLAQHQYLSSAPPHYVKAMVKILVVELDRGLHPGHIARALERCVTDGEVNAHCELVRLGVRQAWGDQLAGACGDCGADAGEHRIGCAERAAELDTATDEQTMAEIHAAAIASLAAAQALPRTAARDEQVVRPPAAADPLLNYLNEPPEPDWSDDTDAEVLSWVTAKLAAAIVDATDRAAALQTIRRLWRGQVAPQHRDLVDGAAEHLRLVLHQRRAS